MEIYRKYGPAVLRKATRILGNPEDARDVVQGLFTDLYHQQRTDVSLPYLYRAVTHRCLTLIRDESNRRRLLEREQPALRAQARTRCDDEVLGTDLVMKLAESLDEETLEILLYRFGDDMEQTEIAKVMGVSRKTVGRRMNEIRAEVRRLAGEGALNV